MTSEGEPTVFICAPQGWTYRSIQSCGKCKRRTRHLVTLYEWYDPDALCLAHQKPSLYRPDWQHAMTRREALDAVFASVTEQIPPL